MKRMSPAVMLAAAAAMFAPINIPATKPAESIVERPSFAVKRKRNGGGDKTPRNYLKGYNRRFMPAGPDKNVAGAMVKNPKAAAQMNAMHDAWYFKKFGTQPSAY